MQGLGQSPALGALRPVDGLCDLEKNSDMNDLAMLALLSGSW